MAPIMLSYHASHRSAQRNVSYEEIKFIAENGQRVHRAGVIFCQLRRKDMPDDLPVNHPYWRLTGTTVVLCKCCQCVITLYRNADAFGKDRQKNKHNLHAHYSICPQCQGAYAAQLNSA